MFVNTVQFNAFSVQEKMTFVMEVMDAHKIISSMLPQTNAYLYVQMAIMLIVLLLSIVYYVKMAVNYVTIVDMTHVLNVKFQLVE